MHNNKKYVNVHHTDFRDKSVHDIDWTNSDKCWVQTKKTKDSHKHIICMQYDCRLH